MIAIHVKSKKALKAMLMEQKAALAQTLDGANARISDELRELKARVASHDKQIGLICEAVDLVCKAARQLNGRMDNE